MEEFSTDEGTGAEQAGNEQAVAEESTPTTPDQFLSDEELMAKIRSTPELHQVFTKMQGAYTRKTQSIAKVRDAASIVERFNSDPEFARQTIQARAQQLGLSLASPNQTPQFGMSNGASKSMPPELVEAVKTNLSPELQWMAPALAASQWAGMQMALQPIAQQQAETKRSTRDQEYESLASQLSEKAPGWEAHEDDMQALLGFLQSEKLSDRRWGSKLELLHKLTAGDGQATAEAARRMGQAARARGVAGSPMATPTPNIAEQVMKPKNMQDAWGIAAKHAMAELQRQGIKV